MASFPAYEVTNKNEGPPLGSVLHTKVSEKCELKRKCNFEIEEIFEWDVKCITEKNLEARCRNDNKELPWIQDLKHVDCRNAILVEALKTYGKKRSTEYHGQPITASVKINHESRMLLIFSQSVDVKKITTFQRLIKDALVQSAKPCIPQNLDNNFKLANLYFNCDKSSITIRSLKDSLEHFCSHMNANLQITSDIVMKPCNAMDVPVIRGMGEQAEGMNPVECAKDTKCLVYQNQLYNHNSNSTKDGDPSVDMNHSRNCSVSNAEIQEKVVGSGLLNNDEKHSDSKENYQRNSKTPQSQFCASDHGNELESCGNGHALKKNEFMDGWVQSNTNSFLRDQHASLDSMDGLVQSNTNSFLRDQQAPLNRTKKPSSTACDLDYQDKSVTVLQVESAQTSNTSSVSVIEEKSHSTEHSIEEHQSKPIEFCCLNEIACDEDCSGLKRKYFGVKSASKEEKVMILIGNQGSGKTALVNFAANFFKGVEDANDKLYYVIMDEINRDCHTSSMTAYTFCFAEDASPITIIDTPGLIGGKETDKNNPLQMLKTFFTNSDSNIQLHAIGYVIFSCAVNLTSSERHMIDFLVEHYGQGISTNFITIVTSVAEMKNDPYNDIFIRYGINSKVLLKFNNTAFSKKELDDFDRAYWKMGMKNWKRCINQLKKLPPLTMKTLKMKQKQIYSTYMIKSIEEKLKNELKSFILAYKETNSLIPPIQEKSEQVWRSAIVLYRLLSSSDSSQSVESVLVKYVDEVAQETSFLSKECVMLLSLCPSQGLLEAGKRMIEFMGPIYNQVLINECQQTPMGKEPEILFCTKCYKQHKIKRVEIKSNKYDVITYHCTACACDESAHIKRNKPEHCEKKCNIPKERCLAHTKNALENILQEFSIPGHKLNIITFLKIVQQNLDEQFNYFIDCIIYFCS